MTEPARTFTFIARSSPYGSDRAAGCQEMALAFSVYNQHVNYVFSDDGVFQLLKNQQGEIAGNKSLVAQFQVFGLYDITSVFVESDSLTARGLKQEDLLMPVQIISKLALAQMIRESSGVFSL